MENPRFFQQYSSTLRKLRLEKDQPQGECAGAHAPVNPYSQVFRLFDVAPDGLGRGSLGGARIVAQGPKVFGAKRS